MNGIPQHGCQLRTVSRTHDRETRHFIQIRRIIDSVMGLSVFTHQSGPVHGKDHMKLLQTDIMQDLIICPLEERRIHGNYRKHPFLCKSRSKGHRMCLRDPDIEGPLRPFPLECANAGSPCHGRRDCNHFRVLPSQFQKCLCKNIRKCFVA